ncbi:acyltransferase [Streptomyces sp. NPDC048612]|uniref:acyltransferase family protein n=1 Tax=Streptomyces sp. NPDC048612 TaxID=3365579 RepID=UPI0037124D2D
MRPERERLQYVDNLRITLTALVVLHHTAITYSNFPAWYYTEPTQDGSRQALGAFVTFNQAFFMGFLFMVAGYFTPPSYDRKGARLFYRDRLKRLGIPLLYVLLRRCADRRSPTLQAGTWTVPGPQRPRDHKPPRPGAILCGFRLGGRSGSALLTT